MKMGYILLMLSLASVATADTDTPGSTEAICLEPFQNQWSASQSFRDAMTTSGYTVTYYTNIPSTSDPSYEITDYVGAIDDVGIVWIESHGTSTTGHSVESWEDSPAGFAAMTSQWNDYDGHLDYITEIAAVHNADGYGISARPFFISQYFDSAKTIIVNKSCYSGTYNTSWTDNRVHVGFPGDGVVDEGDLFGALETGGTVEDSASGMVVVAPAGQKTKLAPRCTSSPPFHTVLDETGVECTWTFDCDAVGTVETNGEATIVSESWSGDSKTYRAVLRQNQGGPITINGDFRSGNGVPLVHLSNQWIFLGGQSSVELFSEGNTETSGE